MGSNKLTDKNRLSIVSPELCKEWDYEKNYPLRPENVSSYSHKKVWWKNKDGTECQSTVANRNRVKKIREIDAKKILSYRFPHLAKEWHPTKNGNLTPHNVRFGSGKKVWWVCKKGHEFLSRICERTGHKTGCPYCSGHLLDESNCLATKNPKLAQEWNYKRNIKNPKEVMPNSNKKYWWVCSKGHEWESNILNRNSGQGCPFCVGKAVCKDNCLKTLSPELAKEWHPNKNGKLTPEDVTLSSHKIVWWKCSKNHEWKTRVYKRHLEGCPYCSGHKVCKDNCLSNLNPRLAKEWHPTKNGKLTPDDVTCGSSRKAYWICSSGHEWKIEVSHRSSGSGCPKCQKVELKDGSYFDSLPEAYLYLKLKGKGFKIEQSKCYDGLKRYRCDFYLPQINTYIEVTSFCDGMTGNMGKIWPDYYRKILSKKKHVEQKLKANFRFIQIKMNKDMIFKVRENMV